MTSPLHLDTDFWCPDLQVQEYGELEIANATNRIKFELQCDFFKLDHQFFIGLINGVTNPQTQTLLGILVDPDNGEVVDLINSQGVIGYLDEAPLQPWSRPKLSVEIEKLGSVYIPTITVGTERIVHPALRRTDVERVVAVAGSTTCFLGSRARFLAPDLEASNENIAAA